MARSDGYSPGQAYIELCVAWDEEDEYGTWEELAEAERCIEVGALVIQPARVALPHSCDQWVIGDRADVEALIADLQELLTKLDLPR